MSGRKRGHVEPAVIAGDGPNPGTPESTNLAVFFVIPWWMTGLGLATGWLKGATGSYTAPMQATWAILIIGVGAPHFVARERMVRPVPAVAV
jgi:hypothetical protein